MKKVLEEALVILQDAQKVTVFQKYLNTKSFTEVKEWLTHSQSTLPAFLGRLETLGLDEFVKFDPTIVRGLDYYTGVVFEIFDKHPENRRAVAGGGAFANLLAIFGEQPLPGVGFGMGEVTLTDFLKTHQLLPDLSKQNIDILIAHTDETSEAHVLALAQHLRSKKIKVEVFLGEAKPKKIFSYTDKKQPTFVVMMNAEEIASELQFKNLKTKEVHKLSLNNMDKIIEMIKGSR